MRIDDNEGSDLVRQRHAPEDLDFDVGVMAAQIPRQQHEDTRVLHAGAQQAECCAAALRRAESVDRQPQRFPQRGDDGRDSIAERHRADEREGLGVLVQKGRLQQLLASQESARQSIEQGLLSARPTDRHRAEVRSPLALRRGALQIEGYERSPVLCRHLRQHGPRGRGLALLKSLETSDGRDPASGSQPELLNGLPRAETRGFPRPSEHFRIDLRQWRLPGRRWPAALSPRRISWRRRITVYGRTSPDAQPATPWVLLGYPLLVEDLPHPVGRDRDVHVRHPQVRQRVHHRVRDGRGRAHRRRLADALRAERVVR